MREIINRHYLNFQHVNNVSQDERYYIAAYSGGVLTTHTNGALSLIPLIMPFRARIDRIGVRVINGAGTGRIGIYNTTSAVNLRPLDLVMDSGPIDLSAPGLKTAVVNQLLESSTLYWVGLITSANPEVSGISGTDLFPILGFSNDLSDASYGTSWFATGLITAEDVLPLTVIPVINNPFTVPAIGYRLAV